MLSEVDFHSISGIISLIRLRMSASGESISYIATRNEFHFLLGLIYTMGII